MVEKKDQEADRIIRSLMKETIEQPPSDLNSRVMNLLRENARERKPFEIGNKSLSPYLLSGIFVVCVFIVTGSLLLLTYKPEGVVSEWILLMKDIFPVLLTIGAGVSFFILFVQLDEWLKQHAHNTSHIE